MKKVEVTQSKSGSWVVKVDGVVLNTYRDKGGADKWAEQVRDNLVSVQPS